MQCMGNSGCFPRGKRAAVVRRYPVFGVCFSSCVQYFRVSVIHRTLTWTTGSLICVRSYACVYTRGWGTPTRSQRNILTWKNSHKCVLSFGRDSLSLQHPPLSLQPLSRLSNVWTRRDRNTVLHPACPTRGSNPGSWDMNSDAVTTEPRPPQETRVA